MRIYMLFTLRDPFSPRTHTLIILAAFPCVCVYVCVQACLCVHVCFCFCVITTTQCKEIGVCVVMRPLSVSYVCLLAYFCMFASALACLTMCSLYSLWGTNIWASALLWITLWIEIAAEYTQQMGSKKRGKSPVFFNLFLWCLAIISVFLFFSHLV